MTHESPGRPREATTIAQVLQEVADLSAGAVTVFLPLFILSVPAIGLVVVPVMVAGAIVALAGALLALPLLVPYLLLRAIRSRRPAPARPLGFASR